MSGFVPGYQTPPMPGVIDDRQMSELPISSGLPAINSSWPPPWINPVTYSQRLWDAWWSGDRSKLSWVYYNLGANSTAGRAFFSTTGEQGLPTPRPGQFRGGLLGSIEYTFWGNPTPPGEKRPKLHVPIAGDIARTSANLLFARKPYISSGIGSQANNAYFASLIDDGLHTRLLEAAEICAALGGVYLRVVWDTSVADSPWIQSVPVDQAVPEFVYDKLKSVTFFRTLASNTAEDTTVRHLEKHVPGENAILHGVYAGDGASLGMRVPITDYAEMANIAGDLTHPDAIVFPDMPFDASTVVYVPNMKPNRIWRDLGPQATPLGVSDYSGAESLMDALDDTYTSWMRDIRLGKARIMVPDSYLDNIGRGKGAVFEPERQVYTPMNMLHEGNAAQITMNQFNIRWREHQETAQDFINQIVRAAGYSSQTFGDYSTGNAPTATEIQARERKSMLTRSAKIALWRPALQDIIYGLMCVEREYFGRTDLTPERPDIEFADVAVSDTFQLAATAKAMADAGAASLGTMVRTLHPEWDQGEVDTEVQDIKDERQAVEISGPGPVKPLQQSSLNQDVRLAERYGGVDI